MIKLKRTHWFTKLAGGGRRELPLTHEEQQLVEPLIEAAKGSLKKFRLRFNTLVLAMGAGLVGVRFWADGLSSAPVFDDRIELRAFGLVMWSMLGMGFAELVWMWKVRQRMGRHAALYDAFCATKSGWTLKRYSVLLSILVTPLLGFAAFFMISQGQRVDANGILPSGFPFSAMRSYSEVARITHSTQKDMPRLYNSELAHPVMRVEFRDGSHFILRIDDLNATNDVAEFISAHSGVAITRVSFLPL